LTSPPDPALPRRYSNSNAAKSGTTPPDTVLRRTYTSPRKSRPRAKSLHYTKEQAQEKRNFFLPHFSTDTQYSREQVEDSAPARRVIELGLGDDFDASFGEALRRGVGGEEISLGREAMRVLNEAKGDMKVSKQGRKGSIGMGLFRESRASAAGQVPCGVGGTTISRGGSEKKKRREEAVVLEESEEEEKHEAGRARSGTLSSLRSLGSSAAAGLSGGLSGLGLVPTSSGSPSRSFPIRPRRQAGTEHDLDEGEMSASMRVVASPLLGQGPLRGPASEEESGWTTSASSTSMSESEDESGEELDQRLREQRSVSLEEQEEGEDDHGEDEGLVSTDVESEEEPMTVPLQPFNHAVGGHSSIYKFTRRAVCKVSKALNIL